MEEKALPPSESTEEAPAGDTPKLEISKGTDPTKSPLELLEGVDDLPPEIKKVIAANFQMMTASRLTEDPELLKQRDDHQFQFGLKGLEVTLADRREEREYGLKKFHENIEYRKKTNKYFLLMSILISVLFFVLCAVALFTDKTDFIIELIKATAYVFGGFGTGVFYSNQKSKNP